MSLKQGDGSPGYKCPTCYYSCSVTLVKKIARIKIKKTSTSVYLVNLTCNIQVACHLFCLRL